MKSWTVVVGAVVCLIAVGSAGGAGTAKTVKVDCAKGGSINAALGDKAEELIIEIRGMCREHVVITRDNVTLLGSNPALDGIEGPTGDPGDQAVVEIYDVDDVRLENLTITGGQGAGLGAWEAGSKRLGYQMLVNCRLEGNGDAGAHLSNHSWVPSVNTSFSNNGVVGLRVQRMAAVPCDDCVLSGNGREGASVNRQGQLWCWRCELTGNARWAVAAAEDGYVWLEDSTVSGERGILGYEEAFVIGLDTSVTAAQQALYIGEQADGNWFGGSLSGDIWTDWQSLLYLQDVVQTANGSGGGNRVADASIVYLTSSTLVGPTAVETFGKGEAYSGSSLGELRCQSGGDFYCDGTETKTSSSCGLCP